jgi:hypothetical protein
VGNDLVAGGAGLVGEFVTNSSRRYERRRSHGLRSRIRAAQAGKPTSHGGNQRRNLRNRSPLTRAPLRREEATSGKKEAPAGPGQKRNSVRAQPSWKVSPCRPPASP